METGLLYVLIMMMVRLNVCWSDNATLGMISLGSTPSLYQISCVIDNLQGDGSLCFYFESCYNAILYISLFKANGDI